MRKQIESAEERWLDLDVLMTFKKLAALAGEGGKASVVACIEADCKDVLELDEAKAKVRRVSAMDWANRVAYNESRKPRTVCLGGVPFEATLKEVQVAVAAFLGFKSIRVNMKKSKRDSRDPPTFNGSIEVEFATEAQAKVFLDKVRYCILDGCVYWMGGYIG